MLRIMGWSLFGNADGNNDPRLVPLANHEDKTARKFKMLSLEARVALTPPHTERKMPLSTSVNEPAQDAAVRGSDTTDLGANAPVVLLTGSGDDALRLEARATKPDDADFVWKIERAADDHKNVVKASPAALPSMTASGDEDNILEVQTNATGTFHIKASVDVAGDGQFDDEAEFLCVNMVLVKVERITGSNKASSSRCECAKRGSNIALLTKGGTQGGPPLRLRTKARLIGGGADGRLGVDKVFGGWINNFRKLDTAAEYANTGRQYWRMALLPLHRDGPNEDFERVAVGNDQPAVDAEDGHTVEGWQASHAVLGGSDPNPGHSLSAQNAIVDKTVGGECEMRGEAAPEQEWNITPTSKAGFEINRLWLNSDCTAYLCFWTESAPKLIGVLEEQPWTVRGDYDVNPDGPIRSRTKLKVATQSKTKHSTLVKASQTKLEWCPPCGRALFRRRHVPDTEDLETSVGFKWSDPTSRK